MIKKLSRKRCLQQYTNLPWSMPYREKYFFPKIYQQYYLTLPSKSAKGHAKYLGIKLQALIKAMGYPELIFMGDSTLPWLFRSSDYKPAKEAVDYLIANKLTKTFNGGLLLNTNEVGIFIKHLYWLVRTNTVLAYVHGIDAGQNIIVNVCQHGTIHFNTLNKKADDLFNKHFASPGFQFRVGNTCYSPWQNKPGIKGRSLAV